MRTAFGCCGVVGNFDELVVLLVFEALASSIGAGNSELTKANFPNESTSNDKHGIILFRKFLDFQKPTFVGWFYFSMKHPPGLSPFATNWRVC